MFGKGLRFRCVVRDLGLGVCVVRDLCLGVCGEGPRFRFRCVR